MHTVPEYDRHIAAILAEAGATGLSVQNIARHVFNASNTFFCAVSFDDIYRYVRAYISRNTKSRDSMIESTGERGKYRLNMKSAETSQLMLRFTDDKPEEKEKETPRDNSLSLF